MYAQRETGFDVPDAPSVKHAMPHLVFSRVRRRFYVQE
jgi:hypothetical protein